MSGHEQKKKDNQRPGHKSTARRRDFEEPIEGAAVPQQARDVSNLGETAAPSDDEAERIPRLGPDTEAYPGERK
jgi:hypothetical protein